MDKITDDTTSDITLKEAFPSAVRAVKTGELDALKKLLLQFPQLANARSLQGRTLLHHLCDWPGHIPNGVELGLALIAAGTDVNARAIDAEAGETALQWAASNDDTRMANFLIDAGTPADGLNNDHRPLAQAIWYGFPNVAETLVQRGAGLTLELAAGLGRLNFIADCFDEENRLLPLAGPHTPPINNAIKAKAATDERLDQALSYAVIAGQIKSAALLLNHGASINGQPTGFDGQCTPLHRAVIHKNVQMAAFLLSQGADLSIKDPIYGSTPLGWAEHFQLPEMIDLLNAAPYGSP